MDYSWTIGDDRGFGEEAKGELSAYVDDGAGGTAQRYCRRKIIRECCARGDKSVKLLLTKLLLARLKALPTIIYLDVGYVCVGAFFCTSRRLKFILHLWKEAREGENNHSE